MSRTIYHIVYERMINGGDPAIVEEQVDYLSSVMYSFESQRPTNTIIGIYISETSEFDLYRRPKHSKLELLTAFLVNKSRKK